jgi:FMN phosphatase YigB (HAD superfamily)
LITREDGPFKPDPTPLRRACECLRVKVDECWMIGDGQFDVEAGLAAGMRTVWLGHGRPRAFAAEPWRTVRDLHELATMLRACTLRRD